VRILQKKIQAPETLSSSEFHRRVDDLKLQFIFRRRKGEVSWAMAFVDVWDGEDENEDGEDDERGESTWEKVRRLWRQGWDVGVSLFKGRRKG
jgi:hypothetical protein